MKPNALGAAQPGSDGAILARVAEGDVAALGELYDRYAESLLRFVGRVDARDPEDVVQTVFLRVLRIAGRFHADAASARPWLFAIATHVLQERSRALRRWAATLMRLASEAEQSQSSRVDVRSDVARGLAQLTLAKRSVLILAEVEGFRCKEIAAMLAIPVGTVWTRLHHARRELRHFHDRTETFG